MRRLRPGCARPAGAWRRTRTKRVRDLESRRPGELMNRDEIKGKARVIKGRVKQSVGRAADNPRLHDEGVADEASGRVQAGAGKMRRKVGEAVERVGRAVKR